GRQPWHVRLPSALRIWRAGGLAVLTRHADAGGLPPGLRRAARAARGHWAWPADRGDSLTGDSAREVPFNGEPADEAARQDESCNRNMCSLATNFIDFGFTVFMDAVVADRAELDRLLDLLAPRPVRLDVL